jgi:hypothetical protein
MLIKPKQPRKLRSKKLEISSKLATRKGKREGTRGNPNFFPQRHGRISLLDVTKLQEFSSNKNLKKS